MRENRSSQKIRYITVAAIIAALYVILTLVSASFGLAGGIIQVRISEALCILPVFTSAAIPGLTVGCAAANLILSTSVWDIILGSLATFIGAELAYLMRRRPFLSPIPTVIVNTVVVPVILALSGIAEEALLFSAVTVFIGELIACGIFGTVLLIAFRKKSSLLSRLPK